MKLKVIVFVLATTLIAGTLSAKEGSKRDATRALEAVPVISHTTAPLRVHTETRLDASVSEVWDYISDHSNLLEYSNGALGDVSIDSSKADPRGVGLRRVCETPDRSGRFVERVVHVDAPYAFAYVVEENTWGMVGQLGRVSLRPDGKNATVLQWDIYFDHQQPEMASEVANNIRGMMQGMMLPFLTEKFGGEIRAAE